MSFKTNKLETGDKNKFYELLARQVEGLLSSENDLIANAANLSSLLYHALEDVNWVGFYFFKNNELVLGPFQGQVACTRIPIGKGVCGTAFSQNKIMRIKDVNTFSGHIACDSASNSELVIPVGQKENCIGVLDIDSPIIDRFDHHDETGCNNIVNAFLLSLNKS